MPQFIKEDAFEIRLRYAVSAAWEIFARKVGGGLIPVNKEASMQLQYAYVLKQLLPMTLHQPDEQADLLLESPMHTPSGYYNADIVVNAHSAAGPYKIAIELKCYRKIAASGGNRGAGDIFMKDVYADLQILEEYVEYGLADVGVALVMNDMEHFVSPKKKKGKCWAYDTSHGTVFPGGILDVRIGGKPILLDIRHSYTFNWFRHGDIWFTELEGVPLQQ